VHVENENPARLQAREPELAAIIGEAAVVRFVASPDRLGINDFAVRGRARLDVHDNEFV